MTTGSGNLLIWKKLPMPSSSFPKGRNSLQWRDVRKITPKMLWKSYFPYSASPNMNLKLTDIDSKRNLIIIRQAKGRKDRIAPLSLKVLELLRSYFEAYKPIHHKLKSGKFLQQVSDCKINYRLQRRCKSCCKLLWCKDLVQKPLHYNW